MVRFTVTCALLLLQAIPSSALEPYAYPMQFTVATTVTRGKPSYPDYEVIAKSTTHQDSVNNRFVRLLHSLTEDKAEYDLQWCVAAGHS
jgi:hypothetical protein